MTLMIKPHTVKIILILLCLSLALPPFSARAEEEQEDDTVGLYDAWQQQSSTASRAPKPLSQTPESITIITADDIRLLNAHTLADVLVTVPGIQIHALGGPGSSAYTYIQSDNYTHTLVQLDGAPLNKIGNFSDIGSVPARIIERIEIVKGAASAAWGPALGGVINVITKAPEKRAIGGSATASLGSRTTADTNAELTGSIGKLGYYLSAGYLGSKGILEERHLHSNNTYAKLTYDLSGNGQIWVTVNQSRSRQGENYTSLWDFKEVSDQRYLDTTLGLRRHLTDQLGLELVSFYTHRNRYDYSDVLSTPAPMDYVKFRDRVGGANARLAWKGSNQLLVGGLEFIYEDYNKSDLQTAQTTFNWNQKRLGLYLNDTITIGPVTLVPGARYDNTRAGDQFSPSIGATWQVGEKTLLRAFTARGYGFTSNATSTWNAEKIWTNQLGIESSAIPYLWQKLTLFRNMIWHTLDNQQYKALGVDYELRTTPIHNISFGGGYNFTDLTHTGDGTQLKGLPRHTVKLLLRYDDQTYRAALTGSHVYWNHVDGYNGNYFGILWDLHLGATVWKRENSSLELFFSGHNLFNGAQYADELQPNTGRWFEGGARIRF